ncbi:MAG TPA: hypothetical protein DHU26_08030 [Spirochaetaceae bacterium]|nr:hypothetical protein [Spirochaetaceae bacterium]
MKTFKKRGQTPIFYFMIAALMLTGVQGAWAQMPGSPAPQLPSSPSAVEKRSIRVQGQASMSVEPDVAMLTLGVETQSDTAAKAQAQLADRASKVLAALTGAGIDRAKIKTSYYRVSPVYSTKQDKQNVIIGYKAETTIQVEISDIPAMAGLVDLTMNAGANAVRSLNFDRKNMEAFKAQLIEAACKDAQLKAQAALRGLAGNGAGLRLGAPISVDVQDSFSARNAGEAMMFKAAASPDFVSAGELEISVAVAVEFEILVNSSH